MITKRKNIGRLNKYVTFRERTTSADGMGGTTDTGSNDILSTWVSIEPVGGDEYFKQDATNADVTHRIVARYREDLQSLGYSKDRYDNNLEISYDGRVFNVHDVRDMGEDKNYVMMEVTEEL